MSFVKCGFGKYRCLRFNCTRTEPCDGYFFSKDRARKMLQGRKGDRLHGTRKSDLDVKTLTEEDITYE